MTELDEALTIEDHIIVFEVLPLLVPLGVLVEHHTHRFPKEHIQMMRTSLMSLMNTRWSREENKAMARSL